MCSVFTFWLKVEDTRKLIDELKDDVAQVRRMHSKILSSPIPDDREWMIVKTSAYRLLSSEKYQNDFSLVPKRTIIVFLNS